MSVRTKLIAIFLLCSVAVFGWASFRWWRVQVYECWFDGVLVASTDCQIAQPLKNQLLLTLNLDDIAWQAMRSFTDANQKTWQLTTWRKRLPQSVVLRFESSPARYVVTLPDGSGWLVNQRGFLQSLTPDQAAQSGLPKIAFGPKWPAAEYANYQLQPTLHDWLQNLFVVLMDSELPPSQITLIDSFTVEVVWSDWQLVLTPQMDLKQVSQRLTQIDQVLNEKNQQLGVDYTRLDLRFKLPVLEPKNPLSQKNVLNPTPLPTREPTATPTTAQVKQ